MNEESEVKPMMAEISKRKIKSIVIVIHGLMLLWLQMKST